MAVKFFETDYDPSLPEFHANEELLIQIFTNLIKNGCEAQNNNGKIILKTSYNANKKFLLNENDLPEIKPLQVEVIDFGIGIPDSDLQNIFDPFVTNKVDGKGLGLSIVSNSIRTLDGSIEVSSENGLTNFCINFPLKMSMKDNYEKNFSS